MADNLGVGLGEGLNTNQNRISDLMNTITEARKSLQNWQDQKTEALIKLDALSYDIRVIGEEKDRAKEAAETLRKEMENEVRVYQGHVDHLTDQIQLLQIEREGLENQLNEALAENQDSRKEILRLKAYEQELQEELKTGIAAIQQETEARLSAQFEKRYQDELQQLRDRIQNLNEQNFELLNRRNESDERANRLDRELDGIRSHMMSVLRVADGAVTSREAVSAEPKPEPKIDARKLRAVEIESGSVDVDLKRLGY